PLSIDVSTGDVITPSAVQYEFGGIFDDNVRIKLWGYNIETVMAEKVETVLSRGIFNTRPRDYYDIYILSTTQKYDKKLFQEALTATASHRGSIENIADTKSILTLISSSEELQDMWAKYQKKFAYAHDINYEQIIKVLDQLMQS
ncbi:MAG: nucleotidyl transferase AbiEii/AbiGii toxin family protein, partial [Erysipelotrichaceae bacterium]